MKSKIFFSVAMLVITSPLIAWYGYKPVRVFFPELAGVVCVQENICVENIDKLDVAETLYLTGLEYVQASVSSVRELPRFIFCETQSCFAGFGFNQASAQSFGVVAVVVGPRGWKRYIVQHEMIHHIQNEKLGSIRFLFMPEWFVEGMAYSMSQDPRAMLTEPWESHRRKFNEWYKTIEPDNLWQEAAQL